MTVPVRRVTWPRNVRIIHSIHPPIDLFEDIADPADREALASAEAKFNSRIRDSIGDLSKVPVARRVTGPGASWVMAPFVHCSPCGRGSSRTAVSASNYANDRTEVAIAETIDHLARFMRAMNEAPGWTSKLRELIESIDAELDDATGRPDLLDPNDYRASQVFGAELRAAGSNGITWPSIRYPDGQGIAVFWPAVIPIPTLGAHFAYHWNGATVDFVKQLDSGEVWHVTWPCQKGSSPNCIFQLFRAFAR